jgi:hypothetical protein
MAHCSPLCEAVVTTVEVQGIDEAMVEAELGCGFGENTVASNGEKRDASLGDKDILNNGVSDSEKLSTYYFRFSIITVGKIKEMEDKGYFAEDEAHA